jgi:hypothetical protein
MEMQKLEKSAGVTQPSFWKVNGFPILATITCLVALSNFVVYAWGDMADHSAISANERADNLADKYDAAKRELAAVRADIDAMTGETVPGFGSASAKQVYDDCLQNPVGIVFAPDKLGMNDLTIHNVGAIVNASGTVFALGDHCKFDLNAKFLVAAHIDGALELRVLGRETGGLYACPSSAYELVKSHGAVVDKLLIKSCLALARSSELPDHAPLNL